MHYTAALALMTGMANALPAIVPSALDLSTAVENSLDRRGRSKFVIYTMEGASVTTEFDNASPDWDLITGVIQYNIKAWQVFGSGRCKLIAHLGPGTKEGVDWIYGPVRTSADGKVTVSSQFRKIKMVQCHK